ncbi:MAG: PAS domain S-box protein [Leptolyngbyaceae cyanobacterium]
MQDPIVVSPHITVREATVLMHDAQSGSPQQHSETCGSSVVVVESGNVVGMLTEQDVVRLCAQHSPLDETLVGQVMTTDVPTLPASALSDPASVLHDLQQTHIRHLPVVDDQNHLIGLVTQESLCWSLNQIETQELQQREAWYRGMMEGAADGILIADRQGKILAANQKAETLLGYSLAELTTLHFTQLYLAAEVTEIAAAFTEMTQTQHSRLSPDVMTFQRRDGVEVPVEVTTSVIEVNGDIFVQGLFRDISERRSTEQECQRLLQELTGFKLGLNQAAIVTITNARGVITYANQKFEDISGYSEVELIGQTHRLVNSDTHPHSFFQELWHTIQRGEVWRGEICNRAKDGHLYWVDSTIVPFLNAEGVPERYLAIRLEITTQKQARLALQESQRFLKTILDTVPLRVFWKNRELRYLGANAQFLKDAALSSLSELIGKKDFDLPWADTEAADYRADDRRVMESGHAKLGILETLHRQDGTTIWVETNKLPLRNLAGEVIGVLGTYQDITKRRHAEIVLRRQLAAIEAAIDGIAILQGGRFVYLNSSHVELFGYKSTQDLIGQPWQILYSPDELQRFEQEIWPVLSERMFWQGEVLATRQDGTTFPEQLSLTVSADNLLICVCQDISDRKAAEAELLRTNAELARATRLKDEFLANMSHELRTPLNAILGMTESLQEEAYGIVNDKQLDALQTVESSANHLLSLINDILDVAKIESGQVELEYSYVAVEQLCASALTFVKQQALKKRIQLQTQIPCHLPDLFVDEIRTRQVLLNLLTNAVKFTPTGGMVTLAVSLVTSEPESADPPSLRLAVTDTGIGIAPDNISRLFQPFVQIDGALNRQHTGTGLGLALVKQIVELHGGQVGLTSELGEGSCFTIDLPYQTHVAAQVDGERGAIAHATDDTPVIAIGPALVPVPLILLAEDNPANIATISGYLKVKGYQIICAQDGQEAIDLACAHQPDVILMDVQMPGMDGLEAIQQIRQQESLQHTPIIAVTALAMKGDRERCLAAGADLYLSKPVRLRHLDSSIKELLGS